MKKEEFHYYLEANDRMVISVNLAKYREGEGILEQ